MNKNLLLGSGVFLAVVIAGVFLVNQKTTDKVIPTPQSTTSETSKVISETTSNSNVKEIVITETEYSFGPSVIQLKKGDKVRLTFKNEGGLPHNFIVDDLNLKTGMTKSGSSETLEFTADTVGEFSYYCGIGNHRDEGMEGKLIVTQ